MKCFDKNCKKTIFLNKFCLNHYKLHYYRYIIIIQKNYKGYKCRKKLNNIYKNLPEEIQNKILFYIKEPILYKKYCNTINKIIRKKSIDVLNVRYHFNYKPNVECYIKTYEYFKKYKNIMYINDLKFLYILSYEVSLVINNVMYLIMEYNDTSYDINFNLIDDVINIHNSIIDFKDCSYSSLLYLEKLLFDYKYMYNDMYNINKRSVFI
jgi:hypothetical protein